MGENVISQMVIDTFEVRYYKWSLAEFQREIDGGFPSLRSFPSGPAHKTLLYLQRLSQTERHSLARALVKR